MNNIDFVFLFITSALNNLKKGDFGGSSRLVDVLFGETDLSSPYNLKGWHHLLVLFFILLQRRILNIFHFIVNVFC